MSFAVHIKMNEKLYLRNPELSDLGRKILSNALSMIYVDGFENFTFKKLAQQAGTTEATIYRYFENKHRLLIYMVAWYWSWLQFNVIIHTQSIQDPETKIKMIIDILVMNKSITMENELMDINKLHQVIIAEGSKAYLTKHVNEDNKDQLFKPYKDLCRLISEMILEYNPKYGYSRSLASTMVEIAHFQDFFMNHLPSLTDFPKESGRQSVVNYLEDLVLRAVSRKK